VIYWKFKYSRTQRALAVGVSVIHNRRLQMTNEEKQDWSDLCNYVKYDILDYTKDMKFPKFLVLRLKGLAEGNFISNKKQKPNAKYSFKEILLTCKVCKTKIKTYFTNNSAKIKDESHKINLIMGFIEQEINDVVQRISNKQKSEEKINELDLSIMVNDKAEYKSSNNTKNPNKKLEKLW